MMIDTYQKASCPNRNLARHECDLPHHCDAPDTHTLIHSDHLEIEVDGEIGNYCDTECYVEAHLAYHAMEYQDYAINGHPLVLITVIQKHLLKAVEHTNEFQGRTLDEMEWPTNKGVDTTCNS